MRAMMGVAGLAAVLGVLTLAASNQAATQTAARRDAVRA